MRKYGNRDLPRSIKQADNNFSRREIVRGWHPRYLVQRYNSFVAVLVSEGKLDSKDRDLLKSMEQEGVEMGGKFYGKITTVGKSVNINHSDSITRYSHARGMPDTLVGERKLQVWKIVY